MTTELEKKYIMQEELRAKRMEKYRKMMEDPASPNHGTPKGYRYGCRCEACMEAIREYRKERAANA